MIVLYPPGDALRGLNAEIYENIILGQLKDDQGRDGQQ